MWIKDFFFERSCGLRWARVQPNKPVGVNLVHKASLKHTCLITNASAVSNCSADQ
jgi:hypothetical protein